MAITLLEEMALEKENLRKGIIMSLLEQVSIQDRIPWESTGALSLTVTRLTGVPRVPLRGLNEVPSSVKVNHTQSMESLHIMETDIDIDPVLLLSKNTIQSLEVAQTQGTMRGIGYQINDLFINADPALDVRNPQGLMSRLRDDARFAAGTVNATTNSTKANFTITATDAEMFTALDKLDELLFFSMRGNAKALISNQQFVLRMWSAMRRLRILATTKDQFDRKINMYQDVPILDAGYKPEAAISGTPDAATTTYALGNQIIPNDGDDYDAGNVPGPGNGANAYTDSTTVYAVNWGENELVGLQEEALRVKGYGETQEAPHFVRTNIRWVFNPCVPFGIRSIGRLVGLDIS